MWIIKRYLEQCWGTQNDTRKVPGRDNVGYWCSEDLKGQQTIQGLQGLQYLQGQQGLQYLQCLQCHTNGLSMDRVSIFIRI